MKIFDLKIDYAPGVTNVQIVQSRSQKLEMLLTALERGIKGVRSSRIIDTLISPLYTNKVFDYPSRSEFL